MDNARGLIVDAQDEATSTAPDCPECGTSFANSLAVPIVMLQGVAVRRCLRCGRRSTREAEPRWLRNCESCRLPFLDERATGDGCASCGTTPDSSDPPERSLIAATEAEVQTALADAWSFVGSAGASGYLRRVLGDVADRIDGAPRNGRVVLLNRSELRTLALPSGVVILSVGMLGALEDEAELAFVIGHELAHVAAGDAASRLVQFSLRELALGEPDARGEAWSQAAADLVRLGHGDRNEHRADAVAFESLVAAGYDPEAALAFLRRLADRANAGDPDLSEMVLAHPPPAARLRRMEAAHCAHAGVTHPVRVDREVFRRAVGHTVIASELVPVRMCDDPERGTGLLARLGFTRRTWTLAALALLVLMFALWFLR